MERWNFVSYDVWGNSDDGYEVNQAFTTALTLEIKADASEDDWRQAMQEQLDFSGDFEIDFSHEDVIYLTATDDGKPLGEFRLVQGGAQ